MPKHIVVKLSENQIEELETVRHHHAKPYMRERAAAVLKVAEGENLDDSSGKGTVDATRA